MINKASNYLCKPLKKDCRVGSPSDCRMKKLHIHSDVGHPPSPPPLSPPSHTHTHTHTHTHKSPLTQLWETLNAEVKYFEKKFTHPFAYVE